MSTGNDHWLTNGIMFASMVLQMFNLASIVWAGNDHWLISAREIYMHKILQMFNLASVNVRWPTIIDWFNARNIYMYKILQMFNQGIDSVSRQWSLIDSAPGDLFPQDPADV